MNELVLPCTSPANCLSPPNPRRANFPFIVIYYIFIFFLYVHICICERVRVPKNIFGRQRSGNLSSPSTRWVWGLYSGQAWWQASCWSTVQIFCLSLPHEMRSSSVLWLTSSVLTLALADVHVFAVFGDWSFLYSSCAEERVGSWGRSRSRIGGHQKPR